MGRRTRERMGPSSTAPTLAHFHREFDGLRRKRRHLSPDSEASLRLSRLTTAIPEPARLAVDITLPSLGREGGGSVTSGASFERGKRRCRGKGSVDDNKEVWGGGGNLRVLSTPLTRNGDSASTPTHKPPSPVLPEYLVLRFKDEGRGCPGARFLSSEPPTSRVQVWMQEASYFKSTRMMSNSSDNRNPDRATAEQTNLRSGTSRQRDARRLRKSTNVNNALLLHATTLFIGYSFSGGIDNTIVTMASLISAMSKLQLGSRLEIHYLAFQLSTSSFNLNVQLFMRIQFSPDTLPPGVSVLKILSVTQHRFNLGVDLQSNPEEVLRNFAYLKYGLPSTSNSRIAIKWIRIVIDNKKGYYRRPVMQPASYWCCSIANPLQTSSNFLSVASFRAHLKVFKFQPLGFLIAFPECCNSIFNSGAAALLARTVDGKNGEQRITVLPVHIKLYTGCELMNAFGFKIAESRLCYCCAKGPDNVEDNKTDRTIPGDCVEDVHYKCKENDREKSQKA
ncbi:hypothetical protein R3P38DRAFT_2759619 [Favolaschia claudopus]|uniref:Uncharacterized protein n=1 Tax=Favolaschia claudopus TaxID=2862362 RepID=A0AAW0E0T9_9AGAR